MMIHILGKNSTSSITNVKGEDILPCTVGLRLYKIYKVLNNAFIIPLHHSDKKQRGVIEISPNVNSVYILKPGTYQLIMENIIKVGDDEAGWVTPSNDIVLNGCGITSKLYEPGYHGPIVCTLFNPIVGTSIEKGAVIAQYVCVKAESLGKVDGIYQTKSPVELTSIDRIGKTISRRARNAIGKQR